MRNSEAVNNIFHHSPETELKNFPSSGTLSAYSQLSTLEHSLGTGDVSEYQFQKQQRINAIVNLKILANIKAAVAAKTMNSLPLSSNYLSPVRPSSSMFCGPPFKSGLGGANKIKPRYRPNTYASCVLARYLAHLQQVSQCSSSNALSSTTPEYHSRADLSDESGNESYSNHVFTSRKSRRKHFWDLNQNRVYPRPSEHSRSRIRNSIDSDHGGTSSIGQDRRSSNADSSAFEDVDTDELTFQVSGLHSDLTSIHSESYFRYRICFVGKGNSASQQYRSKGVRPIRTWPKSRFCERNLVKTETVVEIDFQRKRTIL